MARRKLRPRREVIERCAALRELVAAALERSADESDDPAVVEAVWQGEGLGVLLWAFALVELPPYDRPFDHRALLDVTVADAQLRPAAEVTETLEAARLWLWRARTAALQDNGGLELPPPWQSVDQLVAATAMRGHERGLLPRPLRGDFPAFGTVYRALAADQGAEALSIAWERDRALEWLTGLGSSWDDIPSES
jgi:hypothetical protein